MCPQESTSIPTRKDINLKDTWAVHLIYSDFEAWDQHYEEVYEQAQPPHWPSILEFKQQLHDPSTLKKLLEKVFTIKRALEKLEVYAHLRKDEDLSEKRAQKAHQKISTLINTFEEEVSWIRPELLLIDTNTLRLWIEGELQPFAFYLEKILHVKPHTLSQEHELLCAMSEKALSTPYKVFSFLNNVELHFEDIIDAQGVRKPLSHGLYHVYLKDPDPLIRKQAAVNMSAAYQKLGHTFSELLQGLVQSHIFQAKTHRYKSCVEAALYPKNIPTSLYFSLIDTVKQQCHVLHRYIALKKEKLQLKSLHTWDLHLPLHPTLNWKISYQEAEELVIESVAVLGDEYQQLVKQGLQQKRWVDRYENQNKRSGAYSGGCYDSEPYILMNYQGGLNDLFTLAHEVGHSMHSLLSQKNQPYHHARYPIFVAEVASTFNEALLMDLLLKTRSCSIEKEYLLHQQLEQIRTTFFRQTLFAEFEWKIHHLLEKQQPVTATDLNDLYAQLSQEYLGPAMTYDQELSIEWARIPHFYFGFYVYQYATGISAALALAQRVLSQEKDAVSHYLNFLSSGGNAYPLDLLKTAGVDLRSSSVIEHTISHFAALTEQLFMR